MSDFFISVTTNPEWPEIKKALRIDLATASSCSRRHKPSRHHCTVACRTAICDYDFGRPDQAREERLHFGRNSRRRFRYVN
ncbi:hypothetical protein J6590_035180 [Homalodisca vitripennis]|nr:hypothetical protein J6590_035180 [Homalodisca vitripennis]